MKSHLSLAVGGGIAWGLQFGREGFVVAPWLALVPLLLLLGHPRAVRLALLHGVAAWLTAIYWIAPTLVTYGGLGWVLGVLGLVLLAAYLAAYQAAFAWLGRPLWRRCLGGVGRRGVGLALAFLALPALWVSLEWVRGHLFSGFPWNLAGYAWVEVPGALPATAWIGAYGLSGVVVLANAGAALALVRRRWEPLVLGVLVPLLLCATAGRWGAGEIAQRVSPQATGLQPVRIVQPDIQNLTGWDPAAVQRNYGKLFRLSRQACDRTGALLLWPESAAWPYSYDQDPTFRRDVDALAARCPVLLNSVRQDGAGRWFNSGLLVAAGGPTARYDKRHLVPFGEYVPLAGLIPFFDSLTRNAGDFTPAREVRLLPWKREEIGLAICFEVTFPAEVAETVQQGATVLATLTNDAWYGDTTAPWQHFRAARFRAAENRRPLLRAAITGVSGVIGADGSVLDRLGVGEEGVLRAAVEGRRDRSPFSRHPDLVPLLAALVAASAILGMRWRGAARAMKPTSEPPAPTPGREP